MSPRPTFPPPPQKSGKHRLFIGIMLAIVLLGGIASFMMSDGKKVKSVAKREEIITITLPPPLPPPIIKPEPPPPIEKPPEPEEMVEQEQVPDDEPPPEDSPAPESPPSDFGSNASGSGPPMGGGTGGNGKIGTGRKGGGSKWGYYAAKVQTTIKDALGRNASTRSASFSLQVRVWADSNGRITRAQLVGTSGNPAVDQSIRNQVLTGLQLPEPPPAGMPMPINMRISARKS